MVFATWLAVACLVVACTHAQMLCITGSAPLVLASGSPPRPWCNSGGTANCMLDFSFQFNVSAPSAQRWQLNATLGLGANRTVLATLFPALSDLAFQCSSNGDIVASTRTGPQNQRLRLVWTYAGSASTTSCTQRLLAVDLVNDMLAFSASLAYSGFITVYDAVFLSTDTAYSLGLLAYEGSCADRLAALEAEQDAGTLANCSSPSACRFPSAQWALAPLKSDPAWQAFLHSSLCTISYADIINNRGARVHAQGGNWLAEARELIAVFLNAARADCSPPYAALPVLRDSYAYLNASANCARNQLNATRLAALRAWNDNAQYCTLADTVDDLAASTTSAVHATATSDDSTQTTYMIVMIVFICLFAASCCFTILICCFCTQWGRGWMARNIMGQRQSRSMPPTANMAREMTDVRYSTVAQQQQIDAVGEPITSPPPALYTYAAAAQAIAPSASAYYAPSTPQRVQPPAQHVLVLPRSDEVRAFYPATALPPPAQQQQQPTGASAHVVQDGVRLPANYYTTVTTGQKR